VTNTTLAQSYLEKAQKRLKILDVLFMEEDYSDVIREAQEIVELALKGMLRSAGIEPPKWHDVGGALMEYRERFPEVVRKEIAALADVSAWLRKEREFSFYGEIDFIPTEEYGIEDAKAAMDDACFVVSIAEKVIIKRDEK
jgi:HEPN domain-containing protein